MYYVHAEGCTCVRRWVWWACMQVWEGMVGRWVGGCAQGGGRASAGGHVCMHACVHACMCGRAWWAGGQACTGGRACDREDMSGQGGRRSMRRSTRNVRGTHIPHAPHSLQYNRREDRKKDRRCRLSSN